MSVKVVLAAMTATLVLGVAVIAGVTSTVMGSSASGASAAAVADIPAPMLALYQRAALDCPGLDWSVLAAVGKIETDHGRSPLPGVSSGENAFHAAGPMQFVPATWDLVVARHRIPPGGRTPPSRYDPHDAVHAAAFYLCDSGAATDLREAVFAYNHSTSYVNLVLAQAATYRATTPTATGWDEQPPTVADPSGTGGRITPRLNALYQELSRIGALSGGATCWDPHPQNPDSDHPRGKACDVFFNPRDRAEVTRGWQVAAWLTAHQAAYGIHYLIWQGQIWTAEKPDWDTYRSSIYGCPNSANLTGCHYDHIHISIY